jgi:hypothetical protein
VRHTVCTNVLLTSRACTCFIVAIPKVDVMNLSSSDTEGALNLLFLSPARGPHSLFSNPYSSSDSDLFKDWPEANDMTASVYVELSADALSSHAPVVDVLCDSQEPCAGGASAQKSHPRAASSMKPQRQKVTSTSSSQRKSKRTKVDVDRALVAFVPRGGSVSAVNFDKSEWEIMYPLFVAECLVDPCEHVNRKDA